MSGAFVQSYYEFMEGLKKGKYTENDKLIINKHDFEAFQNEWLEQQRSKPQLTEEQIIEKFLKNRDKLDCGRYDAEGLLIGVKEDDEEPWIKIDSEHYAIPQSRLPELEKVISSCYFDGNGKVLGLKEERKRKLEKSLGENFFNDLDEYIWGDGHEKY